VCKWEQENVSIAEAPDCGKTIVRIHPCNLLLLSSIGVLRRFQRFPSFLLIFFPIIPIVFIVVNSLFFLRALRPSSQFLWKRAETLAKPTPRVYNEGNTSKPDNNTPKY
jgi:hypothetical protein